MTKKIIKTFLVFFLVFSTILGTGMYFYLKPVVAKTIEEKKEEEKVTELDVSNYKERVNVLLLGVDVLATNPDQRGTRTDTIIVLSVDPVTNTGFLLSIPRDSYVKVGNRYDKINHAHSYGGTDLALTTIKDFIKIPIHHYIKVDYRALFKTVDNLGGIEFNVPIPMKYKDSASDPPLNINLEPGLQMLNGEQAMGLLRYRKTNGYDDYGRMNTQKEFIVTLLKKLASPSSITKIPKYVDTIYQYVETDLQASDILGLIKLGMSIDTDMIERATLPAESVMINGISYMQIDKEKMAEQLTYLLSGDYKKEEPAEQNVESSDNAASQNSSNASSEKKPAQKNINDYDIAVLNGSGKAGVARRVSDLLKIQDIIADSSGNAKEFTHEKTIIYYKNDVELANKIKDIIKVGTVKKGTKEIMSSEPEIVVLIGKDFE